MLTIKLDCQNGHRVKWNSQPTLDRMAADNLALSCAILFSGETYARLSHFAKLINIQFFSKQLYNIIQKKCFVSRYKYILGAASRCSTSCSK